MTRNSGASTRGFPRNLLARLPSTLGVPVTPPSLAPSRETALDAIETRQAQPRKYCPLECLGDRGRL
eukprot:902371-Rhodomonas_salina.2